MPIPDPPRYSVKSQDGGFIVFDTFRQEPCYLLAREYAASPEKMYVYESERLANFAANALNRGYET